MGSSGAGAGRGPARLSPPAALSKSRPSRAVLLAFGGFVLIGGVNFVGVRYSNQELPPLLGAGMRFGLAALVLAVVLRVARIPLPRGRALFGCIVYGTLAFGAAYGFAYTALTDLPAGAGAVVFASYPLFTVFLAALHGVERFRARALTGAVLAVIGIVILSNPASDQQLPLIPMLVMTASAVSAAEAGVLIKRFPIVPPVAANAVAMSTGTVILFLLSAGAGETWIVPTKGSTIGWVAYLAVVGSAGLFGLFLFVLHRWTATATSYATALLPVSAMLAGAGIGGEPLTVNGLVGAGVMAVAVYVGALSVPATEPAPTLPPG